VQRAHVPIFVLQISGDFTPAAMDFNLPATTPVFAYLYGLIHTGIDLLLRVFFVSNPYRISPATLFRLIFARFSPAAVCVYNQGCVRKTGKRRPVLLHDLIAIHLLFLLGKRPFRCLPRQLRFSEVHRVISGVGCLTVRFVSCLRVIVLAA